MRITCSLDVACVMDSAGNSGARNLYVFDAKGYNGRLDKFPGVAAIKPGRGGASGGKKRITSSLDVACVMDCAGNSGARNLYAIGAMGYNGRLNKFPRASPGRLRVQTLEQACVR